MPSALSPPPDLSLLPVQAVRARLAVRPATMNVVLLRVRVIADLRQGGGNSSENWGGPRQMSTLWTHVTTFMLSGVLTLTFICFQGNWGWRSERRWWYERSVLDDNAVLSALPARTLTSAAGLTAEVLDDGALRRLEAFGLSLLLHPASVSEAGLANVHLRVHRPDGVSRLPLLGPGAAGPDSGSRTVWRGGDRAVVAGVHEGVAYRLTLTLGREHPTWHWRLTTRNTTDAAVRVDAVLTHDPALAPLGAVRTNEYYVAQYLDVSPVAVDGHGTALAVRQNMPGPRVPWLLVGTTGRGTGWATDALQLTRRTWHGVDWPGLDAV